MAHDFSNLLNVINGYSELALENPAIDESVRDDLENILESGRKAASLTSQLLAFSRTQLPDPEILDLNEVISEMSSMLKRLIDENIEFKAVMQPDIGLIKADIGQVHQIVMNLAVNARDAMPRGGLPTIETADVDLDKDFCSRHTDAREGSYIMLAHKVATVIQD